MRRKPVMDAKDIAALDAREYRDPKRDLQQTIPHEAGEAGGARGDIESPSAQEKVPGSIGETENKVGSDEVNRLAKGRNA